MTKTQGGKQDEVMDRCKKRLKQYDATVRAAKKKQASK